MIRINLLPEEYRRKSRTPVKLMLTVTAAVTVNSLLLAWWSWLAFGVSAEVESERGVLQTEMDGLTPQVNYHKALDAESKRYIARESALGKITQGRVNWTRKIDELVDVVHTGGEGVRHYVWFDDLNVQMIHDQRRDSFGSLSASGHSGSDNFAQVANFLEDVETSVFLDGFHPPAPPEGTQTMRDEDLMPAEVWNFPLSLLLRNPEEAK